MRKLVRFLIAAYRSCRFIVPPSCIYTPTCSQYAQEAFEKYPFSKALQLTLARLGRCNFLFRGGADPLK